MQGNPLPSVEKQISKLAQSTQPYQKVIGIVSRNYADFTSTGHNSVQESDHPLPVALNGRVPVKVTTENGAIEPGDFLTTSSTPGAAMKATKPGNVIGKALEGYNSDGVGKIMVFVNLTFADPDGIYPIFRLIKTDIS